MPWERGVRIGRTESHELDDTLSEKVQSNHLSDEELPGGGPDLIKEYTDNQGGRRPEGNEDGYFVIL